MRDLGSSAHRAMHMERKAGNGEVYLSWQEERQTEAQLRLLPHKNRCLSLSISHLPLSPYLSFHPLNVRLASVGRSHAFFYSKASCTHTYTSRIGAYLLQSLSLFGLLPASFCKRNWTTSSRSRPSRMRRLAVASCIREIPSASST